MNKNNLKNIEKFSENNCPVCNTKEEIEDICKKSIYTDVENKNVECNIGFTQEQVNEFIKKAQDSVVCNNDQVKCDNKDNSELKKQYEKEKELTKKLEINIKKFKNISLILGIICVILVLVAVGIFVFQGGDMVYNFNTI